MAESWVLPGYLLRAFFMAGRLAGWLVAGGHAACWLAGWLVAGWLAGWLDWISTRRRPLHSQASN